MIRKLAVLMALIQITTMASTTPDPTLSIPHFCSNVDGDYRGPRYSSNTPYCRRNVSAKVKEKVYEDYKIPKEFRKEYTIDHIVPLSLGGSNNILNLWPQPKAQSTAPIEGILYRQVESGLKHPAEAINELLRIKYSL